MSDKELYIWLGEKLITGIELIEIDTKDILGKYCKEDTKKYYIKLNNLRIQITKERYQALKCLKED